MSNGKFNDLDTQDILRILSFMTIEDRKALSVNKEMHNIVNETTHNMKTALFIYKNYLKSDECNYVWSKATEQEDIIPGMNLKVDDGFYKYCSRNIFIHAVNLKYFAEKEIKKLKAVRDLMYDYVVAQDKVEITLHFNKYKGDLDADFADAEFTEVFGLIPVVPSVDEVKGAIAKQLPKKSLK